MNASFAWLLMTVKQPFTTFCSHENKSEVRDDSAAVLGQMGFLFLTGDSKISFCCCCQLEKVKPCQREDETRF